MYLEIKVIVGKEKYEGNNRECSFQFFFNSISAERIKELSNTIISDMVVDAYEQYKDLILNDQLKISITDRKAIPF